MAEPVRVRGPTGQEGRKPQQTVRRLGALPAAASAGPVQLAACVRRVHGRVILVGREALRWYQGEWL
ncbi:MULTISPECIES: hypothetical protein [Streptomyces]|uniref:hypothetical protein n=1 Tax=Streptomyces TaxID=1883 RepID=UPI0016789128|nr:MULTISPECIES: hypothetical protein [Streptomyces]MBK3521854.1 hypothetical protein [Streptomyces sp. MBT70]GGR79286.1 hypothetical protein GCM10010236_37440 [Streptomyces eurythermus]